MRRIALINQKGGVGKTTTTANLGAALAREGRRVVLVDLDPQANLSLHLDCVLASDEPSIYTVLLGQGGFASALRATRTPNLELVPSSIDLSGAELELASAIGRESLLRDALDQWEREARAAHGVAPADYLLLDCPPSLGLLSINGLVAAQEAIVALQTEFFALQGISKLVDVVALLQRRLNPKLEISGILPCLYDSRLKLAREVLAEIRSYFPGRVFRRPIGKSVKLAEAPSYGKTIFEYAPDSPGALDYRMVALEVIAQEARDPELAALPRAGVDEPPPAVAEPRDASVDPAESTRVQPELREVVLHPPQRDTLPPREPATDSRRNGEHVGTEERLASERELETDPGPRVAAMPDMLELRPALAVEPRATFAEELPELPEEALLLGVG